MGSLITYSGIATKVKAMERWRLTDGQFEEMAALESVPDAVEYLRRFKPLRRYLRRAGGRKPAPRNDRAAAKSVPVSGFREALTSLRT